MHGIFGVWTTHNTDHDQTIRSLGSRATSSILDEAASSGAFLGWQPVEIRDLDISTFRFHRIIDVSVQTFRLSIDWKFSSFNLAARRDATFIAVFVSVRGRYFSTLLWSLTNQSKIKVPHASLRKTWSISLWCNCTGPSTQFRTQGF